MSALVLEFAISHDVISFGSIEMQTPPWVPGSVPSPLRLPDSGLISDAMGQILPCLGYPDQARLATMRAQKHSRATESPPDRSLINGRSPDPQRGRRRTQDVRLLAGEAATAGQTGWGEGDRATVAEHPRDSPGLLRPRRAGA